MDEDSYTAAAAAKILRLTKRRIIQLITEGDLEGEKGEDGRWLVPQRAVHDRLGERPPRASEKSEDSPERVRELEDRVEDLHGRIGELREQVGDARARAELTEVAESTLREQLQRERERADRLEEELRTERAHTGFWRRLFGG